MQRRKLYITADEMRNIQNGFAVFVEDEHGETVYGELVAQAAGELPEGKVLVLDKHGKRVVRKQVELQLQGMQASGIDPKTGKRFEGKIKKVTEEEFKKMNIDEVSEELHRESEEAERKKQEFIEKFSGVHIPEFLLGIDENGLVKKVQETYEKLQNNFNQKDFTDVVDALNFHMGNVCKSCSEIDGCENNKKLETLRRRLSTLGVEHGQKERDPDDMLIPSDVFSSGSSVKAAKEEVMSKISGINYPIFDIPDKKFQVEDLVPIRSLQSVFAECSLDFLTSKEQFDAYVTETLHMTDDADEKKIYSNAIDSIRKTYKDFAIEMQNLRDKKEAKKK